MTVITGLGVSLNVTLGLDPLQGVMTVITQGQGFNQNGFNQGQGFNQNGFNQGQGFNQNGFNQGQGCLDPLQGVMTVITTYKSKKLTADMS